MQSGKGRVRVPLPWQRTACFSLSVSGGGGASLSAAALAPGQHVTSPGLRRRPGRCLIAAPRRRFVLRVVGSVDCSRPAERTLLREGTGTWRRQLAGRFSTALLERPRGLGVCRAGSWVPLEVGGCPWVRRPARAFLPCFGVPGGGWCRYHIW
ncbi:hypothetical protein NDU88_003504 [Pleurodeles waltl]|uniref:Uncharacterized protein n=1 Tax=Pleurodeles waltl TaxID=8319 RepID=A0AAV7LG18_PLEWA|nr:hypothetical protein NDU88_003504 [Pleurodeles waltl]